MKNASLNQVQRYPQRASYERAAIHAILDEALVCHISIVQDDQPVGIPMLHARIGDELYLHGAHTSRLIQHIASGASICLSATLLDGLVLARSACHSSINYRSAVVFGHGRLVDTEEEKMAALEALTQRLLPGRWEQVRQPNQADLDRTAVVAVRIESASAKARSGPPIDDPADLELPAWAGVIPTVLQRLEPIPVDQYKDKK